MGLVLLMNILNKLFIVSIFKFCILSPLNAQQNYFFNYDFEFYTQCPDNAGQADRCMGFYNLIKTVDYSNCNYDITQIYPSDPGAYSGTGFMTLATYGNPNGASEAVAQNLVVPLDSGVTYRFHVHSKKPNGGDYVENCGGVYVYGFTSVPPSQLTNVCPADITGSFLLGYTDTISELTWSAKELVFTAPANISTIALAPACAPSCFQVVYIDSISISLEPVGIQNLNAQEFKIYPVPADNQIEIHFENKGLIYVSIFNLQGKKYFENELKTNVNTIDTSLFPDGVYFVRLITDQREFYSKLIVQH